MVVRPFLGIYGYYSDKDAVMNAKVQRSIPQKREKKISDSSELQLQF